MQLCQTLASVLRAAAFLLLTGPAFGQDASANFPAKPVKLIVPYAPGGLPDTMARIVAQRLSESLGQQFVVDNRPSAGGIIACEMVASAAPDGYTLLVADVGQTAINPALYKKLSYNPISDFAPVSLMGKSPLFLVAHASVPASNFSELMALLKSKPGQINYGSAGIGSIHHLAMEMLKAQAGVNVIHVPYKGSGQSVPALVGGQVSLLFTALPAMAAHIKAGSVKVFAVNTPERSPQEPNIPTFAELGVPEMDLIPEIGILAPAGTPGPMVNKLSAEIAKAVRSPDTVQRFRTLGIDPVGNSPEAYAALIRADIGKYAKAVRISGAKPD